MQFKELVHRKGMKIQKAIQDTVNYAHNRVSTGAGIQRAEHGSQLVIWGDRGRRGGMGGGVQSIPRVPTLPSPTDPQFANINKENKVFWLSEETGLLEGYDGVDFPLATGDDQVWTLMYPQNVWYPTQKATDRIGEPGV